MGALDGGHQNADTQAGSRAPAPLLQTNEIWSAIVDVIELREAVGLAPGRRARIPRQVLALPPEQGLSVLLPSPVHPYRVSLFHAPKPSAETTLQWPGTVALGQRPRASSLTPRQPVDPD